jgi:hypothetical protein
MECQGVSDELIDIAVGTLKPGTHTRIGTRWHFPALTYAAYEQTFRLLMERPEVQYPFWPIYDVWNAAAAQIFGEVPASGPGSEWAWPGVAAHFRRMAMSFQMHGYKPELAIGCEQDIQVVDDPDSGLCVIQGNKRTAMLRLLHGHDHVTRVRIVKDDV